MNKVSSVMHSPAWRILLIWGAVILTAGTGASADDPDNPFPKRTAAPVPVASSDADLEALQLSGITMLGSERSFNVFNTRTKKSYWVSLNESFDGFTVVGFNPASDTLEVQRGQFRRAIALRQPTIMAAPPAAVRPPTPPAPNPPGRRPPGQPQPATTTGVDEIANPKTPREVAQAEAEARNMVSDLLEIGMQERARQKALREAQQRGQQPPPPQPVQPQPAPPATVQSK
jgi:hypothetical protein